MSDIDLCVFISSKNRYGRYDDYKITIRHLFNNNEDKIFKNKFLSLKIFENDLDNANNIINFFSGYGFQIFIIKDNHNIQDDDRYINRQKFIGGIAHDICSFFIENSSKLSKYVFVLEDDSPIIIKQHSLDFYIEKSISELENDPNLEGIHFLRLSHNEIPTDPVEWFIRHEIEVPDLSQEIYKGRYWYNFQPRVNKTEDLINICRIIKSKWEEYFKFLHPEDAFDKAYKIYNKNIKIYAFSPSYAYSIHLGAEPYAHQAVINSELDIYNLYKNIR
jgi:hypothetical protein